MTPYIFYSACFRYCSRIQPVMNLQVLLLALAAGSVSCQGPFHAGTTSYTLYKNKWPILELFESNWTSTVQGADRSWVVVMYASWCGHCQRFAPTYVSLAKSLNGQCDRCLLTFMRNNSTPLLLVDTRTGYSLHRENRENEIVTCTENAGNL